MKHMIFTVLDLAAKAYIPPFILPNQDMAIRTFSDCVNDDTHAFSKHPEDYTLYAVGSFDDNLALLTPYPERLKLGNGLDFLVSKDREPEIPPMLKTQSGV